MSKRDLYERVDAFCQTVEARSYPAQTDRDRYVVRPEGLARAIALASPETDQMSPREAAALTSRHLRRLINRPYLLEEAFRLIQDRARARMTARALLRKAR